MAYPISDDDRAHFAAVQQALVADGLHLAIASADHERLNAYAGALARTLAQVHGWRVEAYQASKLESIVADLMLSRFDAALARISTTRQVPGAFRAATRERGLVLFIPDAQMLPLRELEQLTRIAAGTRMLRLVALFSGAPPLPGDARLRALGARLALWDLDDAPQPSPSPYRRAEQRRQPLELQPNAPQREQSRPSRLKLTGMIASAALLLLALLPAAPWRGERVTPATEPALSVRGTVQLAGEPPTVFGRAPEATPPAPIDDEETQ